MDSPLSLVDVNTHNLATTWPLLLDAIDSADFISLDLVMHSNEPNVMVSN